MLVIALVLLLLPFVVGGLLLVPSVQNKVVDWAADYTSEIVGSEITIGAIYLEPFRTLRLDDVLVRDVYNDTLLRAGRLFLELNSFDSETGSVSLNLVKIHQAHFNLYTQEGDSLSNLSHLLAAFPKSDTSSSGTAEIYCDELVLDDIRFDFNDFNTPRQEGQRIDFAHIGIDGVSGRLSDISIVGDSIAAGLKDFCLNEQSGFKLRHLTAAVIVCPRQVTLDEMTLVTNTSILEGRYSMLTKSWKDYADFLEEVVLDAKLLESDVRFNDIAFFAPEVKGLLLPMKLSGYVKGTIDNLKAEVDSLTFAKSGRISGNVKIKGLPNVNALFIDADLEHLYATVSDVEQVNIPSSNGLFRLSLPEEVQRTKYLQFKGKYVGFVNDFVAFGVLQSALGTLEADINLKSGEGDLAYSGKLASKGFKLGRMVGVSETIQDVAFDLELEGQGTDLKTMEVEAQGSIARVGLLGYNYHDIDVDGLLAKQVFEGNIAMHDTNVAMDFNGRVDLNGEIPQISCYTELKHLRPGPLNIIPEDTFGVFSSNIRLDLKGKSKETINGTLVLSGANYENQQYNVALDSLVLDDKLIGHDHDITLTTDLVNAHITGNTNLFDLPYALIKVSQHYAPKLIKGIDLSDKDTIQDFDFTLEVKNDERLVSLISPELTLRSPLVLNGRVNTIGNRFYLSTDTISWAYGNMSVVENVVKVQPMGKDLVTRIDASRFSVSKEYFLENLQVEARVRNDSLMTDVAWSNSTEQADSGYLALTLYRSDTYPLNAELSMLGVRIAGVKWRSEKIAQLHADTNELIVRDLKLTSPNGYITCSGRLESGTKSELVFDVKEFDLAYLSNFGVSEKQVNGMFNGRIDLHQEAGALVADADLSIDSLVVDEFEIGNITGGSKYSGSNQSVNLNLDLNYHGDRNVRVIGDYYPARTSDQLDIEASLNAFRVEILEPFIGQYASNLEGQVDGSVSITGMMDAPQLKGGLNLKDFKALVQYLNTTYTIPNGTVKIEPDLIAMDGVEVIDEKQSVAKITAGVFHNNFKDISYDIFLDAKNFLVLNTTVAQNESYYGRANISGDIDVSGYDGHTLIDVVASTNKGTRLEIPLAGTQDVSELDYIRFVPPPDSNTIEKKEEEEFSNELNGLELDFRLSVNDNAEVQIIFDEKIGDVIKVRGAGDMLMQIDNKGKFNMYGDYVINEGDYLFTLQNIVGKRFDIESGSHIVWSGSPYEAKVDLTAIYKLRTSPANLVYPDSSAVYKQRMPVEVNLEMKGALLEPTISFDVDLPSLPESDLANQLLDKSTSTEEERNKQAFALLITNNFMQSGGNFALGGTGTSTTYEMLSNQLSNWISQYSDRFDLGVNLRKGDGTNTADQGEVSISTGFLDDRLQVELNGSVQGDNPSSDKSNNVAGEFNVEYKISKDGSLKARVYNENNSYSAANLNQSPYTQGAAIFYRKEFNTWREFFTRDKAKKERKKKEREQRKKDKNASAPKETTPDEELEKPDPQEGDQ